jgi:hypothetical protein
MKTILARRDPGATLGHIAPEPYDVEVPTAVIHRIQRRMGKPTIEIELRRTESSPWSPVGTPIFATLEKEWPALYASRQRALRWPTTEIRAAFDLLVVDWRCSHCEVGDHAECPGCSCVCSTVAVTV